MCLGLAAKSLAAEPVDWGLVLLADASGSIDDDEIISGPGSGAVTRPAVAAERPDRY